MALCRDALLVAPDLIHVADRIALDYAPHGRGTVGWLDVHPNSRNVISGQVKFSVAQRAACTQAVSKWGITATNSASRSVDNSIAIDTEQVVYFPPQPFAAQCITDVRQSAARPGLSSKDVISGAGHDVVYLARGAHRDDLRVMQGGICDNEIADTRQISGSRLQRAAASDAERGVESGELTPMKVLIARMNDETNTFSPVETPLAAFGRNGPSYARAAFDENKGMQTAMAAFIDAAERAHAEIVTPISASANPGGRVDAAAYDAICDAIVAAATDCDAVLLDLHGAMVAENSNDGEGDLLARVRALLPHAPIAIALDRHGNVTQKMIDNADVIVSFKTYPHVDMYETGAHAARLLFDMIEGRTRPVIAWRQPPLLAHTLRSASADGAMKRAVDAARAAEADGMLAVSVLAGFSSPISLRHA